MKDFNYLYGLDATTDNWDYLPYEHVLLHKIDLAKERIDVLYKAHYLWRDDVNINDCYAAISFNETLLKELHVNTRKRKRLH